MQANDMIILLSCSSSAQTMFWPKQKEYLCRNTSARPLRKLPSRKTEPPKPYTPPYIPAYMCFLTIFGSDYYHAVLKYKDSFN